jgi:hypothetical protein
MSELKDMYSRPRASFPRLNNINFQSWRDNMVRFLQSENLWDIVEVPAEQPSLPPDANTTQCYQFKVAHAAYIKKRGIAAQILYEACSAQICIYIDDNLLNPHEIWTAINSNVNTPNS